MKHTYDEVIQAVEKYNLSVTPEILEVIRLHPEEINGCGAKGGINFPSTMWGILIIWACYIHDAAWYLAKNRQDLEIANMYFSHNIKKIIDTDACCKLHAWIARYRAASYTSGVDLIGTEKEIKKRGF